MPGGNAVARGGYLVADAASGARQATLIASGSELGAALAARALLAGAGIDAAVVSLPCWELFARQDAAYRAQVLGEAPRFGIEAACGFGWERWLGEGGRFVGMGPEGLGAQGWGAQGLGEAAGGAGGGPRAQAGLDPPALARMVGRRSLMEAPFVL